MEIELPKKKILTILWILIVVTMGLMAMILLFRADTAATGGLGPQSTLALILGLLVLLGASITGAVNMGCKQIQARLADSSRELGETVEALEHARDGLEKKVEKRTFEITLVNASLNREIAERSQAETEARMLKRRIELILESAGEGIFGLDHQGNVTFVNKAATVMLGWSAEELVGHSHHSLVHYRHADGSDYDELTCPIYMAYRDGKVHNRSDDVFWTRGGSSFPVEYVSTPILDNHQLSGAVVLFRDLTRRRQAERETRELQRRLELILNCAGEGIFGLDHQGNVTFVNKAATVMLGWSAEELVGHSHHRLVHHSHADGSAYDEHDCPIYMAYRDGKVHNRSDDVFWTRDGSSFQVEYVSTPIVDNNRYTGAVVLFRDLSIFK